MIGDIHIIADPHVTWDNYEATAARCRAAGYDGVLTPNEFARVTDFMARGLTPDQAQELMMIERTEQATEAQQSASAPGELPPYICHKVVRAAKIVGFEITPAEDQQHVLLQFEREDSPRGVIVEDGWLITRVRQGFEDTSPDKDPVISAAEKAVGGYYVVYDNEYTSWSPGDVFEAGYTPIVSEPVLLAEATLSERPFASEDLAMTVIPNGHVDGLHAGIVLERVIDTADEYEQMSYALFEQGDPMPLAMLEAQSGPAAHAGVNGFTLENLLAVVIDRLKQFQDTDFRCQENKMAIHHAEAALGELNARTNRRIARGVEGTHQL